MVILSAFPNIFLFLYGWSYIFSPIRYKGKIWIRVAPRKGIASEADEHILLGNRATNITTFDTSPCFGATLDDLNQQVFKHDYLPKVIPDNVNESDKSRIKDKMQVQGFYNTKYDFQTYQVSSSLARIPSSFLAVHMLSMFASVMVFNIHNVIV